MNVARRRHSTAGRVQYGSLEERVPGGSSIAADRLMVDAVLVSLSSRFDEIYREEVRKSIPQERLIRALLLLQMLYSVRSERMLIEQPHTRSKWLAIVRHADDLVKRTPSDHAYATMGEAARIFESGSITTQRKIGLGGSSAN